MASIPLLPKGVLPCDRRGELRLFAARFSSGPGRKTGLTPRLLPLVLVATLPNPMAQSPPLRESVLFSVYRQYLLAIEAHDFDKLEALSADQTGSQQLAKLKEVKDEKQQGALLDLLGKAQPESAEMVNEKMVGDRGLLAIQGYSRGDLFAMKLDPSRVPKGFRLADNKPIKKRQYELVRSKRIGGEWKIYRIKSFTYKDPRPLLEPVDGWREQKYLGVQFHCDCSQENVVPGDKAFQWMNENSHGSCFAQLRRNASLCDRIGSLIPAQQKAFFADNTQMQQTECKLDVVGLIGDPRICESIKNSKLLPNAHEQCLEKIEDYDFIPGFNIYALDSDGDGLSDLEEIEFFNTCANHPDTDGDGKTDFEEVEAMTNPLGTGRLGDHLK
jgi:hypothetical protein